jgi:hypothetical protein
MPACPHYPSRHAFHTANFEGIVSALVECLYTVSGVGTTSFTIDPSGYASNFEGIVQCIEDLNFTLSGLFANSIVIVSGVVGGSGIYVTPSGGTSVINVNYPNVFQNSVSGHVIGQGIVGVSYSGNSVVISGKAGADVTVSGSPNSFCAVGDLWFDTNQGRLFVYASGGSVSNPDWYQTNAEALANISQYPPSGTGLNAPVRDGVLWFNTLLGTLFIYDATSSGWYETQRNATAAYGAAAPAPDSLGSLWYDTVNPDLRIWNGTTWTTAI